MQGRIISFHETLGQGIIVSDDGRRYRFTQDEIHNPNSKLVGLDVDFLVESRRPIDIIVLHGSPWRVFESSCRT